MNLEKYEGLIRRWVTSYIKNECKSQEAIRAAEEMDAVITFLGTLQPKKEWSNDGGLD